LSRLSGALKLQVIANKQTISYPTSHLPEINDTSSERPREGFVAEECSDDKTLYIEIAAYLDSRPAVMHRFNRTEVHFFQLGEKMTGAY
jgi:hypothetical protein